MSSIKSTVAPPGPGSVRAVAERLQVSIPTIYAALAAGHLRAFRIGRSVRITDDAVAEFIREGEAGFKLLPAVVDNRAAAVEARRAARAVQK